MMFALNLYLLLICIIIVIVSQSGGAADLIQLVCHCDLRFVVKWAMTDMVMALILLKLPGLDSNNRSHVYCLLKFLLI